jgi:hypothetical protein
MYEKAFTTSKTFNKGILLNALGLDNQMAI